MTNRARQISTVSLSIALFAMPTRLRAQSELPGIAPTSVTAYQSSSDTQATVNWDGHLLQITATGQGLGQIIQQIAKRADVHLAGAAPDDAVYGTYGPGLLVDVLSELVDGLPTNMLFVEHTNKASAQLTFSARDAVASPPGTAQQQFSQSQMSQSQTTPSGQQPNGSITPPPGTHADIAPVGPAPAAADVPANSIPASPNGVKTPQEIFEQLQRLRATTGNR